jgi:hypothetical protein
VKESDFGENDQSYHVITHLGNILQAGDLVLGYDLAHSVRNVELFENLPYAYPDVILVRKTYPQRSESAATTSASAKKKKASGRGRRRRDKVVRSEEKEDSDAHPDKAVDDSQAEGREREELIEDEDHGLSGDSWLDVDDIEYELYRQQAEDEERLLVETATATAT